VPTIKIMTNTARFHLLSRDMDFNAGRYLDGESMETLGEEAFGYAIEIASGRRSVGERAGHSQAQLWREWRQTAKGRSVAKPDRVKPDGRPVACFSQDVPTPLPMELTLPPAGTNRFRLIVPTSLCAGQIARLIADKLEANRSEEEPHYRALPHTEGCGASGEAIDILEQTIAGYAVHPLADRVLLLEHGCEKTHNDAIRNFLDSHEIDHSALGFASIQLDGGIERVTKKVMDWFELESKPSESAEATSGQLCLGITAQGGVPGETATALAMVVLSMVAAGGSVIIPETSSLLQSPDFSSMLCGTRPRPTLSYGEIIQHPGLHFMATPGQHLIESLTGMGSSGANLFLVHEDHHLTQGHPFIPTVQIASGTAIQGIDESIAGLPVQERVTAIFAALSRIWRGGEKSNAQSLGNVDFQVSRGWFGVST
jgi:altronate dehydratase